MTAKDWNLVATGIVETCKRAVAQPKADIQTLEKRGAALEARIAELETRLLDAEATIAAMRQMTGQP